MSVVFSPVVPPSPVVAFGSPAATAGFHFRLLGGPVRDQALEVRDRDEARSAELDASEIASGDQAADSALRHPELSGRLCCPDGEWVIGCTLLHLSLPERMLRSLASHLTTR